MLKSAVIPFAVCLGIGVTAVLAREGAEGVVQERMETMKTMGGEMKALADMLKAPETFNRERAVRAAAAVASHAEAIPAMFPEGSGEPPSEASPTIWNDWDGFASHATDLQETALAFEAATESGAAPATLGPDFNTMARSCQGCHEDFRVTR